MGRLRLEISAGLGGLLLIWSNVALADATDAARAEVLFREGRKAFDAGDYANACPKLEESQHLDPQNGTLLNLALCHQKQGKVASAWAEFLELVPKARAANQGEREQFAQKQVNDLEPTLPRLKIHKADPSVEVTVNGAKLASADTALPYDPGPVKIEATAPGKRGWQQEILLEAKLTKDVTVPALSGVNDPPRDEGHGPDRPTPGTTSSPLRTVGIIGMGVGAAVLVFGGVTGGLAIGKKGDLDDDPGCPDRCRDSSLVDSYNTMRTLSSIGIIGGAVLAAAGAVLFFVAPSSKTAAALRPDGLRF